MAPETSHLSLPLDSNASITPLTINSDRVSIKSIYHEDDVSVLYDKGSEILTKYSLTRENIQLINNKRKFFFAEHVLTISRR